MVPWLYFLLYGKIRITKEGEEIGTLTRKGEIFGEMRILEESLPEGFEKAIDTSMVLAIDLDTTGLIRKVTEYGLEGDEFVIKTEQAEMGEVFLNAEFTLSTEEMVVPNLKSTMTNEELSRALTDSKGMIHPARITVITSQGTYLKSAVTGENMRQASNFIMNYTDTWSDEDCINAVLNHSKFVGSEEVVLDDPNTEIDETTNKPWYNKAFTKSIDWLKSWF